MPFILFGTGCAVILINILPLLDNGYAARPSAFKAVSFVIVLGSLLVAMGAYRSPAVALMPDVTPKPLRSKGNAIINLMGAVGGILYLAVAALLYPNAKTQGLAHVNYRPLFLIVSVIMFVAVGILFLTIKEPKLVEENKPSRPRIPSGTSRRTTAAATKSCPRRSSGASASCSRRSRCGSSATTALRPGSRPTSTPSWGRGSAARRPAF